MFFLERNFVVWRKPSCLFVVSVSVMSVVLIIRMQGVLCAAIWCSCVVCCYLVFVSCNVSNTGLCGGVCVIHFLLSKEYTTVLDSTSLSTRFAVYSV
jgi:hypothetical protein